VIDEIANGALWFGLMAELGAREEDITGRIDFDQAGANFYTAAREGLGAHFQWLDGEDVSTRWSRPWCSASRAGGRCRIGSGPGSMRPR